MRKICCKLLLFAHVFPGSASNNSCSQLHLLAIYLQHPCLCMCALPCFLPCLSSFLLCSAQPSLNRRRDTALFGQKCCAAVDCDLSSRLVETSKYILKCHFCNCNQSGQSANDPVCKSEGARARAFPTQIAQGMLWVWPESGPHAWLESAMQSPILVPEGDDLSWQGSDV